MLGTGESQKRDQRFREPFPLERILYQLQNPPSNSHILNKAGDSDATLATSKVLDARRQGATTEAYTYTSQVGVRLRRKGNAADDALLVDQGSH